MNSQERAVLGDLHLVTHVWEFGDQPETESRIFASRRDVPGNLEPIVHLDYYAPAELRAFARALTDVADEIERRRAPDLQDGQLMTDKTVARDRAEGLARRIEAEAAVAARPGQLDSLEQIAREVRALAAAPTAGVADEQEPTR